MRNFQLSALMLIVALTFFQRPAQAQQSTANAENTQTSNSKAVNSELRDKAFKVLESLAGQLNTLQSAENRARMGANIADELWKHDEARARSLFLLVQDDIRSHLAFPTSENQKEIQTFYVFLKLRSDTLERIVKYDAELAFSFFKATEINGDKLPPYLVDEQRDMDLRLSLRVARQNPEIALRLARTALERGLSAGVVTVLNLLNRKHKEQALVLYKEIVEKLRRTNLEDSWEARDVAYQLARGFQPPAIDELAFKDFVGLLVTTAAANGCDAKSVRDDQAEFCRWAAAALAGVEKIDSRAARLKRWKPEQGESEPERMPQGLQEFEEVADEGSIDDLLALAGKYPELSEAIQLRALAMARNADDLDRMRKIANGFQGNPALRLQLINDVARAERAAVLDEEQLAELQAAVNNAQTLSKRIRMLLAISYRAGASNRKTALKFLSQANQMIETMSPGKEQTQFQIMLAMMYCLAKEDRGFAIMESVVPQLNNLVDAAVKLDGYDTSYLREGEWNMSAGGSVGDLLTRLSEGASFFAWSDFDRAMSLTAQFDRAEIRMMAQLKLAQGILAGPHKRSPFFAGY